MELEIGKSYYWSKISDYANNQDTPLNEYGDSAILGETAIHIHYNYTKNAWFVYNAWNGKAGGIFKCVYLN